MPRIDTALTDKALDIRTEEIESHQLAHGDASEGPRIDIVKPVDVVSVTNYVETDQATKFHRIDEHSSCL